MKRGFAFSELHDLRFWHRPMLPIPAVLEAALAAGVKPGDYPFSRLLDLQRDGDGLCNGVIRNSDGTLLVACRTPMPGVTAKMLDWWFGWMGVSSERYRLWHPQAHLWSAFERDPGQSGNLRDRYIGNAHLVHEYIGSEINELRISFVEPANFGFDQSRVDELGTAICGRSGLLGKPVKVGHLVHFMRQAATGSVLDSRFFLGHVAVDVPVIGRFATWRANRPAARHKALQDKFGLDLLRHCGEEMNHLARLLPELFDAFWKTKSSREFE